MSGRMKGSLATRAETWLLYLQEDGTYLVWLGRTRKKQGLDLVNSIRWVKYHLNPDTPLKVMEVALDGYRTDITRQVRKKMK